MERIDINKKYDYFGYMAILSGNRRIIGKLPIHETKIDEYVRVVSFYPFTESKEKVFITLNKKQKLGMLNRHILSVARKLNISQVIIKNAKTETLDYKKYLSFYKNEGDSYWKTFVIRSRDNIEMFYGIILKMIIEEIDRRLNPKYLRKKKLEEIKNNDDNHF